MKLTYLVFRDLMRRKSKQIFMIVLLLLLSSLLIWFYPYYSSFIYDNKWLDIILLTLFVSLAIIVCRSLTNIFSLRRNETAITWCQISMLISVVVWIIGFVIIFEAKSHPRLAAGIGIIGTVLTLIFQDTIKGVIAFLHLRMNKLLNIDDWIQIPKYNVDGKVLRVSLTTVTVYNWDTTISSIPTYVLHSDHLVNLQRMLEGKTYGRRMLKSFIIDTRSIHVISKDIAEQLQNNETVVPFLPEEEIKEGMNNAQLYRIYMFHWLMNHHHISQQPNLMVRWMEQKESGIPLQIYAFIIDSSLAAFEWQQSQIIEHVMTSLEWFGLRLYQSPSTYDANNVFYITDKVDYSKMYNKQ